MKNAAWDIYQRWKRKRQGRYHKPAQPAIMMNVQTVTVTSVIPAATILPLPPIMDSQIVTSSFPDSLISTSSNLGDTLLQSSIGGGDTALVSTVGDVPTTSLETPLPEIVPTDTLAPTLSQSTELLAVSLPVVTGVPTNLTLQSVSDNALSPSTTSSAFITPIPTPPILKQPTIHIIQPPESPSPFQNTSTTQTQQQQQQESHQPNLPLIISLSLMSILLLILIPLLLLYIHRRRRHHQQTERPTSQHIDQADLEAVRDRVHRAMWEDLNNLNGCPSPVEIRVGESLVQRGSITLVDGVKVWKPATLRRYS
ncbi:hypothetical protein HDU76_001946 [Blyttiomyces sp. JEL0837]|nr:hypothetical protein HDU76_001946 [Blyttiomyces sp. JEL0837]